MSNLSQTTWILIGLGVMLVELNVFLFWKSGFSIAAFTSSLNTINSQVWAFLILVSGVATALLFHRAGIAVDIAAGVIGAAVNMFNSLIKPQAPGTQHLEVDQTTTPPAIPTALPTITVEHPPMPLVAPPIPPTVPPTATTPVAPPTPEEKPNV